MKNQIQKIFTSKKIILSILGVFVIGLLCCLSIKKSGDKRDNLLTEIVKYQIQQSTQKTMKNFDVTYFSGEYTPDCPIYAPFIYYALNPKIEFLGVDARQGTTLYTFQDNRYLNFGYYDPSVMGKDEDIKPIFNDHNDQSPKTPQEIVHFCRIISNCDSIVFILSFRGRSSGLLRSIGMIIALSIIVCWIVPIEAIAQGA